MTKTLTKLQTHPLHYVAVSFGLHALVGVLWILKAWLMPNHPLEYLPSVRVDLVALPGHKITDTPTLTAPVPTLKPQEAADPTKEPQKSTVQLKAETKDPTDLSVSEKKTDLKKKAKDKIKNSLAKIKALERIDALEEVTSAAEAIQGNQISKGSSLSGEAKNSLETSYFDLVLEKIKDNWELPQWLQEQKLSAQVLILIDRTGRIKGMKWVKPSGNAAFDQEIKRTLERAQPFQSPPTPLVSDLANQGITLGFPM